MSDPLDDLISTLRSAPLPNELDGMAAAVDAMHDALVAQLEPAMKPTSIVPVAARHRRAPVVVLIAAGVLGFAGVAAAGPGGFLTDDGPVLGTSTTSSTAAETTVVETTVTPTTESPTTIVTTTIATTTSAAAAETPDAVDSEATGGLLVDDPDTDFDETQCAEGNHGETVSSVAHETEPGPDHGAAVSEAAKSSCGKDDDATEDDDSDDDAVTTTVAGATDQVDDDSDDEANEDSDEESRHGADHANSNSGSDHGQDGDHGKSGKSGD